jgi:2,3-dihydroxybiphenyl 1,2-dioxygenase
MSQIESLGYIGLSVRNLDAWISFAEAMLGLQAIRRSDGAVDLRMDDYAWRLRLYPEGSDDIAYAGWEVRDAAALGALRTRLEAQGVATRWGKDEELADRRVGGLLAFTDPEGLACEAFYGPLQLTEAPFVSPLGVRFKTGRQGIGHIVLIARDSRAQEAWWCDVAGFRLSDYINAEVVPGRPVRFIFMRCNARHHSLALAQLPLPKKLQHLMLEVQTVDEVGRALYRCQDSGVHISLTLGRHSNDEMLSFYAMTPSGFDVEYGWGGLEVDDQTWHVLTHQANSAWGHRFQRPPRTPKPETEAALRASREPASVV